MFVTTNISVTEDRRNPTAANSMFAQWWGEVQAQSVIFVQRLVSGTGRGFGSPPLRKHKRYGQFAKKSLDLWKN